MEAKVGNVNISVPNSRPYLSGKEMDLLKEVILSRQWGGDGPFSKKCENRLEECTGCPVRMTSNGTHALELALMSLTLEPGDEVLVPSFTFVSTANCLVQRGLIPVFVDIRLDTFNIDESRIEASISSKTKAVIVVHYAGIAAEMDRISAVAKKHRLAVIEDAAQGVNAFYDGKHLGTLGEIGILSFHQTKNITCGEGGAVVLGNRDLLRAVEIHRHKGTNRAEFLRGESAQYTWIDRGSNYLLADLPAALLFSQLQALEDITARRRERYLGYLEALASCSKNRFQLPVIPEKCRSNYHLFPILLENRSIRDRLQKHLAERSIEASTHFLPLHSSPGGKKFGIVREPMHASERVSEGLLRLPHFPEMTWEEQQDVVEAVKAFFEKS